MNDTITRKRSCHQRLEKASRPGIEVSCIDLEKAAWVFCREDRLTGETQESKVGQENVSKRKSAVALVEENSTKVKRFQRRQKRKSTEESQTPASGGSHETPTKKPKDAGTWSGSSYGPA